MLSSHCQGCICQFAVRGPQQSVSSGRHLSSNAGIAHHKLHRHVHSGNGQGTLAAMEVLSARTGPSAENHWEQIFQAAGITLDEGRALRRFLLQVSCIPLVILQPEHVLSPRT